MSMRKPSMMILYQKYPLNAGPLLERLCQSFITPQEGFFVRTHGTIPDVALASYRLSISGMVQHPLDLSLDELRQHFPVTAITATLQCAGNRRDELLAVKPIPGEVPWGGEVVGNAVWRGVLLRDVIASAGIAGDARHVAFLGLDEVQRGDRKFNFGGSIPIEKAMNQDVLLAYEMNGEPLSPAHGFPLRVIVPGYIGARSVKWLAHITLQRSPSTNYFQAHDYKLFPPHVQEETTDWDSGEMLGELPLNSYICQPQEGEILPAGPVQVQGYAISNGRCTVEKVELSCDGGVTWTQARIWEKHDPWAWCLWKATLHLRPGSSQIIARAWDSAGRSQPEDLRQVWNLKGYANNAWHRVNVRAL